MHDVIDAIQWAMVVLALTSFIGLVTMPVVLLVRDLRAAPRPAGHGPAGDLGPVGVPSPRKPVPPSLGAQAVVDP